MSLRKFFIPVGTLFILSSVPLSFSQQKQKAPGEKERKVKTEAARVFTDWPKQDVSLIITPAELNAYNKLNTDDEREKFIQHFWDMRDPDPDTAENEYKAEYYERIAYANEHYSSGKPGWLSDRGRIYIKFGKPDEIESHPSGGATSMNQFAESVTTYPFEKWFYRYIPGIGSGIEIEFIDPTGTGEFRTARSPNEKVAFMPAGAHFDENSNYRREQDSPFAISDLLNRLDQAPEFKPKRFGDGALTGTPTIDNDPLHFEINAAFFRQSDNRVIAAFTIQTDNRDLVFSDIGGLPTARLNIHGQIITVAERRVGAFEDSVTTTSTPDELSDIKERRSAYAKAVVLNPGRYRVDVRVVDISSGATGSKRFGFEVPRFDTNKLAVSSLVLTSKLENMNGQPSVGPFVIGQNKVVPNLTGTYRRGQPIGFYLQVYNAGTDQTTLRPSVEVEYVLLKEGKELRKQPENWNGMSDAGERLTLAHLLDSTSLEPGTYELAIRIRDQVSGQALSPSAKFTVLP